MKKWLVILLVLLPCVAWGFTPDISMWYVGSNIYWERGECTCKINDRIVQCPCLIPIDILERRIAELEKKTKKSELPVYDNLLPLQGQFK
jgi:hypothetical protein